MLSHLDQMAKGLRGQTACLIEMDRYYARQAFGEVEETASLHGRVAYVEEGLGTVILDGGDKAYFRDEDFTTLEPFTEDHMKGLSVHCMVINGPHGLIAFDVRAP